jgi:cytochrome c oxidase assembly protein subunit 15
MDRKARARIAAWLFASAALVFAMVVVGGVTRLTHSGLSIVEWQPLVGAVPPLSHADWLVLFEKYQRTPEYRIANLGMSLEGFQHIFWWEYVHRLLGRAIGVVFFVPLVAFALRRQVPRALVGRLAGIFALGAAQGAMGWYMVASGLADVPQVSPYRLAAHLGLAFAILAAMLWTALDVLSGGAERPAARAGRLSRTALGLVALVFLMVLSGAFVAGTHAGFAYNTFPLMGDRWIPGGLFAIDPWWRNVFENIPLVQLDHRLDALALSIAVPLLWGRVRAARRSSRRERLAANVLVAALALQVGLGLATLLLVVPVPLAAAHQAGAVVLFAAAVWLAHELRAGDDATATAPRRPGGAARAAG